MEKNSVYVYYFTIDNGLEITDIEYGAKDKIIVSYFWYFWEKEKEIKEKARKYKIYTTNKGYYFNYKGKRIYLSEFIKDF